MFKRTTALLIALLLVAAVPALAGKKPKPYKSEDVTLAAPHPVVYGNTGSVNSVTAKEFESSCATPSSNGLDAYVFEVPKEYQTIQASISAKGTASSPAGYDLDIYMYDKNCAVKFASNAEGTDETGVMPAGIAWVLIHNYVGEPGLTAHIEIAPYKGL